MNNTILLAQDGNINENASIKDRHSIIIKAPTEKVWDIILDISNWSEWNNEVRSVKIDEESKVGTPFKWKIGRLSASSQIQLMNKPNTFAFTCKNNFVKRIYVWTLETDDDQTIATLASSLQGIFTVWVENHRSVFNELLNWLECLKQKAEGE